MFHDENVWFDLDCSWYEKDEENLRKGITKNVLGRLGVKRERYLCAFNLKISYCVKISASNKELKIYLKNRKKTRKENANDIWRPIFHSTLDSWWVKIGKVSRRLLVNQVRFSVQQRSVRFDGLAGLTWAVLIKLYICSASASLLLLVSTTKKSLQLKEETMDLK